MKTITAQLHRWRWPLLAGVLAAVATWIIVVGFGETLGVDPEFREGIDRSAQWVWSTLGSMLAAAAFSDRDGDGIPNWRDSTPDGEGRRAVPPGPKRPPDAIAILLAVLIGSVSLGVQACAHITPTQRALNGAQIGHGALELADSLIRQHCTTERVEASEDPPAMADRCLKAAAAQRLAVDGYVLAVQGIAASTRPDGGLNKETLEPFLARLILNYPKLKEDVEELTGVTLPPLADLLQALTQGDPDA